MADVWVVADAAGIVRAPPSFLHATAAVNAGSPPEPASRGAERKPAAVFGDAADTTAFVAWLDVALQKYPSATTFPRL